jgi:hypothetical protein
MAANGLDSGGAGHRPAFAPVLDIGAVVGRLASVKEARALPVGSVVGDLQGGLTFSDAVAAALEARSEAGWQEMHTPSGETWTVIVVDH